MDEKKFRWANVVAVVSDVSDAQPTRATGGSTVAGAGAGTGAGPSYVWIMDESTGISSSSSNQHQRHHHRAAVTY